MAVENKETKVNVNKEEELYLEAEKARYAAEQRPSKLHSMPLVKFTEQDGKLVPLYREVQ